MTFRWIFDHKFILFKTFCEEHFDDEGSLFDAAAFVVSLHLEHLLELRYLGLENLKGLPCELDVSAGVLFEAQDGVHEVAVEQLLPLLVVAEPLHPFYLLEHPWV